MSFTILDLMGTVLFGFGLGEWLTDSNLVPESFKFEQYFIAMMVSGVLLMIPLISYILKFAMGRIPPEI